MKSMLKKKDFSYEKSYQLESDYIDKAILKNHSKTYLTTVNLKIIVKKKREISKREISKTNQ